MKKYTPEQKQEVLKFFEDGCTVQEIFEASNIPKGTLYRWKSELTKPGASGTEPGALEERVTRLEAQLEKVLVQLGQIKEVMDWADRKMRSEQKQREERYLDDPKPGLILWRRT